MFAVTQFQQNLLLVLFDVDSHLVEENLGCLKKIHDKVWFTTASSVVYSQVSLSVLSQLTQICKMNFWADRWLLLTFHSKVKHTHRIKLHTLRTGNTSPLEQSSLSTLFSFWWYVLSLSKKLMRTMWNIKLVGQWVIKIMQNLALNTQVWYLWKHEIINWRWQKTIK